MRTSVRTRVSPQVTQTIARIGLDVSVARRRRRLTMEQAAGLAGITRDTWVRVERGDPAISLGVLAMAMEGLGLLDLLTSVADAPKDKPAALVEVERLPERVRKRRGER